MNEKEINKAFDEEYIKYRDAFPKDYDIPALAQTEQEPVAWAHYQTFDEIGTLQRSRFKAVLAKKQTGACSIPLYTKPPQRTWVGLTDGEIRALAKPSDDIEIPMTGRIWIFVGDLMAKLKEKNNGVS
jgi:hypothetical protein